FWNADIDEVKKGLVELEDSFKCIICEEEFTKGRIYESNSKFYEAEKMAKIHVEEAHSGVVAYLLGMNPTFLGLSEIQREVVKLMATGLSDKEIAKSLGVADSTVRNHRYKLREKEKQAKLFLSLMEKLEDNLKKNITIVGEEKLCDAHKTATMVDDRYNITDKERETTIKNYMDENGAIKTFPSKAKKKIIILGEVVKNFSKGKKYSEKEINRVLKRIYEDFASIRRALIEYGFVERSKDCSEYWVKE
ncbi:MAG: DUF2087 domain-containing protein, partial [Sarcina sp.]